MTENEEITIRGDMEESMAAEDDYDLFYLANQREIRTFIE